MDDVQCDDSFGDDEMLDDLPESQHDELPISVSAANVTFSKPDHDILPASDASKDPTAGHSPASSQGLEADDGSIFSSRVYPRAGEQQAALAATPEDVTPAAGTSVLARIENIFEAMADVLLNERGHLSVELVTRPRVNRQRIDPVDLASTPSNPVQRLCFPGKSEREAWRFGEHDLPACKAGDSPTDLQTAVVIRILELVHEALLNDVVLSKRDIYYRDPALFGRQSHVDRYVDDIAHTFGVPRSTLHVIAAAKGLITGAVSFCRRDGTTVQASSDREGLLMPNLKDILSVSMTVVRWILVVEKEATFRSIAASEFWETLSSNGIMVTAKGYPDISTRAMLRFLSSPAPQNGFCAPPVYALVDCDPDGIGILSTYKHGSKNLAHETSHLCLPQLQWLGLRSEQIMSNYEMCSNQGLLALSTRDRNKARKMLEWDVLAEDEDLRRELQVMLMLNVKAELQLLDAVADGMSSLLKDGLPV